MPRNRNRRRDEPVEVDRRTDKVDGKVTKTEAKADLVRAKASKSLAVAQKRKWLVILLGIGVAIYFMVTSGKLDLGGIMEKIKGITQ